MIDELLKYQEVDGKLREIEVTLSQSEERKKAVSAQSVLKNANDNVARLDQKAKELYDKFSALTKLYEKLASEEAEYENVVETCEDLEEINYIKKKASALNDEMRALTENVEAISKEIKSVLDEFARLRADMKKANATYKEFAPKYSELKASKEGEMNEIKKELSVIEKKIPPETMAVYKKKRQEKIYPILYSADLSGRSAHCGRCGNELPIACTENLKKGEIVECESCHRLLYYVSKK